MEERVVIPQTDTSKPPKARTHSVAMLNLVLVIAVSAGVYYWQHHEVDNLNKLVNSII